MKATRLTWYAGIVLAYNVAVILWGAYVRASGSGAGCGNHWPTCNGQVIPVSAGLQTLIEFSHRVTSGLSIVLIAGLVLWAWRALPPRHPARFGAVLSAAFIVTEALLGAALVLFQLVASNDSVVRAVSVALHLANTLLLLAALTATAWWSAGGAMPRIRGGGALAWLMGLGWVGLLLVSAAGAVTALGDTLFPPTSLAAGVLQDVSSTAHFLIRLRVVHPVSAIITGGYLLAVTSRLRPRLERSGMAQLVPALTALVAVQLALGLANIVLLAPVWIQLVHLLLSDGVWISWVLMSLAILGHVEPIEEKADAGGSRLKRAQTIHWA